MLVDEGLQALQLALLVHHRVYREVAHWLTTRRGREALEAGTVAQIVAARI
jgi:hypothetical protein